MYFDERERDIGDTKKPLSSLSKAVPEADPVSLREPHKYMVIEKYRIGTNETGLESRPKHLSIGTAEHGALHDTYHFVAPTPL